MLKSTSRLSAVAALLAAAAVMSFPYAEEAEAAQVKRGGVLTVGNVAEPTTMDPFTPSDNGAIFNIVQVCEQLISADGPGTGLEPGLAESWTASADGLTHTFKLREGVKFSNGKPLTTDDVLFSLRKAMDPSASYGFAFEPIKSVEAVDATHIKISLKSPYTPLLSSLSLFSTSIVEKAAYEASPDEFSAKPVCTGPFTVESFERGSQLVLVRNPHYWRKGEDGQALPYLDKVVMRYMPDGDSRVLGLQNGDLDVALTIPLSQATAVKSMEGAALEVSPSYRLDYVYLNHSKKPFDDKRIRLAANYAANRDAMMKAVYFGYGEIANSFMPKVNYWSADVPVIPYDLAKAEALVKEANYDGTPIQLIVDTGNSASRQIATILQSAWAKIGLNAEIVEYDSGTSFGMVQKGDYQAFVSYITSDINDSDELATIQADYEGPTKAFFSFYKNDEIRKLLAQARQESDSTKRAEIYAKIQGIVYNDGYSVPLNFLPYVNGYRTKVQNWRNIAVGWWWLRDMWIDQ